MATSSLRSAAAASAVLAAALLLSGCASSGDRGTDRDGTGSSPTPETPSLDGELDFDAAWLDAGRMLAIVTQGSSSCVPVVEDVSADGRTVSVALSEGDAEQPCTADLTARATAVALPEGVVPADGIELIVTLGSSTDREELDGNPALTGAPGEPTDYEPSAGWFDDDALVLLTWGSSTCPPIVDSIEAVGDHGTVTFATEERVCTMDMAPRATIIDFGDIEDRGDGAFTLELVGDNLDATLEVLED